MKIFYITFLKEILICFLWKVDLCEWPSLPLDDYRKPAISACYFSWYALSHTLATLIYNTSDVSWSLKITCEISKNMYLILIALNNLVSWTIFLITVNPCLLKNQSSFMDFGISFSCFIKLKVTFSLLGRFLDWSSILLLIWFSLTLMSFWSVRGGGFVFFLRGWEEERSCFLLEALIHWTTSSFNFELRYQGSWSHVLNYVHV